MLPASNTGVGRRPSSNVPRLPMQRPFGVSLLVAGWDKNFGFQLYQSDPAGNYSGWKATAIGANHQTAQNLLKQVRCHCCHLRSRCTVAME